jgi:RNA polymerase sigma factor (sigma-70 family)
MESFSTTLIDNDFEIIQDLKLGGDSRRRAEERFFKQYAYYIRQGMKDSGLLEEESSDAYTDSILSAIEAVVNGKFQEKAKLKTFLHKIFLHKCVDIIRKKSTNKTSVHRTADIDLMTDVLPDAAKDVVQKLIEQADHEQLRAQLGLLGDKCRMLLGLFAENYTDKEIAQIAGYKTGEVAKTSRIRCLEKLRQAINNTTSTS